jgi:hypothetical protein
VGVFVGEEVCDGDYAVEHLGIAGVGGRRHVSRMHSDTSDKGRQGRRDHLDNVMICVQETSGREVGSRMGDVRCLGCEKGAVRLTRQRSTLPKYGMGGEI